ncbi:hypothetical protein VTK26DRAFT_405 [Humicola hyalothermophila]
MVYYDIATRAQALTLKLLLHADNATVERLTGLKSRTVNSIVDKALERGFDPETSPIILDKYVNDAPKSGRPSKQTDEVKETALKKETRSRQ